jgi:hypothetical protein
MYLWIKLPEEVGSDDLSFCQGLLAATGLALSPGSGFGPGGRGFIRFALVAPPPQLEAAAALLGEHLRALRAARADTTLNSESNLDGVLDSCKQRGTGGTGNTQAAPGGTKVLAAALAKGLALGAGNGSITAAAASKGNLDTSKASPRPLLSPKPYQQQVIQVRALEEGSEEGEAALEDLSCAATDQV